MDLGLPGNVWARALWEQPVSWPRVVRQGVQATSSFWSLLSVGLWGSRPGPALTAAHRVPAAPPPPLTVAFCFLGDTSIRRYVRVTNLLQAGQLSQGSLTRRAEKADTLGECWQASALAAVGSWAFRLLFLGAEQTLSQGDRGSGPGPATDQLCGLGHVALPLQASALSPL